MHPDKKDFFKAIYWDNKERIAGKRNLEADYLQWENNAQFLKEEERLTEKYYQEKYAVIFIVGVPRSGTTLLSQLLLRSFDLGAFYNAVAKNYSVPLHAYSKLNWQNNAEELSFASDLGNTSGDFSSHEFGYFWQYWLNHQGNDELSEEELSQVDWEGLKRKLYAISGLLKKDLLIKSIVYNDFIIETLAENIPNSKFIFIERDPLYVVQSLLESREKRYGNTNKWLSIRPRNYKKWLKLKPEEQVVNQVMYTNHKIKDQLQKVDDSRKFSIIYEAFTANPYKMLLDLEVFLHKELLVDESIASHINSGNNLRMSTEGLKKVEQAIQLFSL